MTTENPTYKKSQERYKEFEKKINEMDIDDLDLMVALGSLRLDKYMCRQCRERINPPLFKLSVLNKGDEFFSDYYEDYSFDSIDCLTEWIKKFMHKLKGDLSDYSYELNEENGI